MIAGIALRDVLLVGHLVIFAVWFGTDLATFYISRRVIDTSIAVESRAVLASTMLGIEIIARLCLPTMLALGLSLSLNSGYLTIGNTNSDALIGVVWIIVALWVGVVWTIHRSGGGELAGKLAQGDLIFRTLVCVVLWISGVMSLVADDGPFQGNWLAAKVLLFALIMTCGIVIRFMLRPFSAAFGEMVGQGSTPAREAVMGSAIRRAQPLVAVIWLALLSATALGALKVTLLP